MKQVFMMMIGAIALGTASAQEARLNFYSAYVFDDGFNDYTSANNYFNGKVKGGYQVGGSIEYLPTPMNGVELLYLYKGSDAPVNFNFSNLTSAKNETFKVNLNYIMLSGNHYLLSSNKKVEGFGGLMAGVVINNVKTSSGSSSSNTNFAWGAKLGSNIWASHKVGIKLQAQILAATRATGGDLYFSYWGPVEVPDYTTLWQFGLGGGLTVRLGK